MPFVPESRSTIVQRIVNRIVARSSLNDLTQTSQVFRIAKAVGRAIEVAQQLCMDMLDETDIDKVSGTELDERAKIFNPDVILRAGPAFATGSVRFSRQGSTGLVTIASGTQIRVPPSLAGNELVYRTTAAGSIADGDTQSGLVAITAMFPGTLYNVDPDQVVGFVTKPSGVDYVTNPSSITTGTDEETDDEFRARIKHLRRSLTRATVTAIGGALYGVEESGGKTVRWVNVVEDDYSPGWVVAYVDDGAGTAEETDAVVGQPVLTAVGGEVDIYLPHKAIRSASAFALYVNAGAVPAANYDLNPASGHIKLSATAYPSGLVAADAVTADYTRFTGLIEECQKVVDGDPADRVNYPGVRAAGVLVEVRAPTTVPQIVTCNISVAYGQSQAQAVADVRSAVAYYINNLDIGEDVIFNELVQRVMEVQGVQDVHFTAPTANVLVSDTRVARISSAQITVT